MDYLHALFIYFLETSRPLHKCKKGTGVTLLLSELIIDIAPWTLDCVSDNAGIDMDSQNEKNFLPKFVKGNVAYRLIRWRARVKQGEFLTTTVSIYIYNINT